MNHFLNYPIRMRFLKIVPEKFVFNWFALRKSVLGRPRLSWTVQDRLSPTWNVQGTLDGFI